MTAAAPAGFAERHSGIAKAWIVIGWLVLIFPAGSIWQYALAEQQLLERLIVTGLYGAGVALWLPVLFNRRVLLRLVHFESKLSESLGLAGLHLVAGLLAAVAARVLIEQKAIGLFGPVRWAIVLFGTWSGLFPLVLRWHRGGWRLPESDARAAAVVALLAAGFLGIGWIEHQPWPARGPAELGLAVLVLISAFLVLTLGSSSMARRNAAGGLLASAAMLAVLLAMLEVFFRLVPTSVPKYVLDKLPERGEFLHTRLFQFDEAPIAVGKRFKPNLDMEIAGAALDQLAWNAPGRFKSLPDLEGLRVRVHFVTDADGFRNPDALPEDIDVVVAGDSFTAGMEVEHSWPEIFSAISGLETLNLAVPGLGPIAETESIRLYGLRRDPSVVIMAYFEGNDLRDAAQYHAVRQAGISWIDWGLAQASWDRKLVSLTWFRAGAARAAERLNLVVRPVDRVDSLPVYPLIFEINGRPMRLSFLDGYVSMLLAPRTMIEASNNFRYAADAIQDADRISREAGARFVLVYIPTKAHVYARFVPAELLDQVTTTVHPLKLVDGLLVFDDSAYGPPSAGFLATMNDQAAAMADLAASNGIEFLDLTPVFQEQAGQGIELYLPLSIHWNEAGHRLAAETVAAYLSER